MINKRIEVREEKDLPQLLRPYSRYDLMLLGELGSIPFSREGAEILFQIHAERHQKGSAMITTSLIFADWIQVFGDQAIPAALLDRLAHKAMIINCSWRSSCLKQSLDYKTKDKESEEVYEQEIFSGVVDG